MAAMLVSLATGRLDRTEVPEQESEWERMYAALCFVESGNRADAVGEADDVGIIQITPIYVKDVNRIAGEDRFSLDDRYCPVKSREMFEIYQSHYNPERDITKAIRLHNPTAGDWYLGRVMDAMNKSKEDTV